MNDIEKIDLKVVQISNGSVLEPSHVRAFTPYMSETPSRSFYIGNRLTKGGNPPRNAAYFLWADEVRWDQDGDPRGKVAVYDEKRELSGDTIRENIARIEAMLAREKLRLNELYAGPRPNKRAEELREAFKAQ